MSPDAKKCNISETIECIVRFFLMKVILNLIGLSECGKTSILSPYSNLGEAVSLFVKEESLKKEK